MWLNWDEILRLLAACVAGAIIGLERELHDKPAGLRTNIMICLGSAVFTLLSIHVAGDVVGRDPGRIAAQVVTGVGFLGAGAIIQLRGQVIGLTTAATIWLVASIGMAFGAGVYDLGIFATVLTAAVLLGLTLTEQQIARWRTLVRVQIQTDATAEASDEIKRLVAARGVRCEGWTTTKEGDLLSIYAELVGPTRRVEQLQTDLMGLPRVRALRRL